MLKTSTPKRVRLTISVTPAVHSTFSRLAGASGSSISWAMGEWLADTLGAAEHMTGIVERAKSQPVEAIQHLQNMLAVAEEETGDLLRTIAARKTAGRKTGADTAGTARSAGRAGSAAGNPPASNTGGKGPGKGKGKAS